MKCATAKKLISQYIDGDLDARRTIHLKSHLEGCPNCQGLLKDFQKIASNAHQLDEPSPPDSTWHKIQARMETEQQTVYSPAFPRKSWFVFPKFQYALTAAAVLLVAVSIIILGPRYLPQETILTEFEKQQYTLTKLEEAETHYQMAIKALAEAVSIQEKQFDPKVAEVFKTNLEIVNVSIAACKQAVLDNPGDLDSRDYLLAAYKEKTDLLNKMFNLNGVSSPEGKLKKTL